MVFLVFLLKLCIRRRHLVYLETMDGFSWAAFSNINERPKVIFCASDLSQRMFESRHKLSSWTFDNSMSCNWYLEQNTTFLLVLLSISTVCENLICQIPENLNLGLIATSGASNSNGSDLIYHDFYQMLQKPGHAPSDKQTILSPLIFSTAVILPNLQISTKLQFVETVKSNSDSHDYKHFVVNCVPHHHPELNTGWLII